MSTVHLMFFFYTTFCTYVVTDGLKFLNTFLSLNHSFLNEQYKIIRLIIDNAEKQIYLEKNKYRLGCLC